jgi:hypothetical protein
VGETSTVFLTYSSSSNMSNTWSSRSARSSKTWMDHREARNHCATKPRQTGGRTREQREQDVYTVLQLKGTDLSVDFGSGDGQDGRVDAALDAEPLVVGEERGGGGRGAAEEDAHHLLRHQRPVHEHAARHARRGSRRRRRHVERRSGRCRSRTAGRQGRERTTTGGRGRAGCNVILFKGRFYPSRNFNCNFILCFLTLFFNFVILSVF